MANYYSAWRTNEFHVTDEDKYVEILKGLSGEDIYCEDEKGADGRILHFIGGYGGYSYAKPISADDERIKPYLDRKEILYNEDNEPIDFSTDPRPEEVYDKDGKLIASAIDDADFDEFLHELQKILPEDEVFTFTEAGHEKLRYIVGFAIVMTKDKIENIDLESWIDTTAKTLLNNDK